MKLLSHLVPRSGAEDAFAEQVASLASELVREAAPLGVAVTRMTRLPRDPFGRSTPYRATLELTGEGAEPAAFASLLAGLGERIDPFAHPDLCTALVGADFVFVGPGEAPLRYQSLMRRTARFDHAGSLERYREVHSRFGVETPGIEGYVQFHVDPSASREVALAAGLGCWNVDSVSELHLGSLERFLDEISRSEVGAEAIADEEVFVDRARSLDFCSSVERGSGVARRQDRAPSRGAG